MPLIGLVENMKQQMEPSGWIWDDYLKMQGLNDVTVRDNFRENAELSLKRRLVLRQFIIDEKLTVQAEDVDAKVEERLSQITSYRGTTVLPGIYSMTLEEGVFGSVAVIHEAQ